VKKKREKEEGNLGEKVSWKERPQGERVRKEKKKEEKR